MFYWAYTDLISRIHSQKVSALDWVSVRAKASTSVKIYLNLQEIYLKS